MSLKENMDYIKSEVSAQESLLENVFKVEKIYKKYKGIIYASVGIVVAALIGYGAMDYMQEKKKIEANELFNTAIQNPADTAALNNLKEKNEKLYQVAVYLNKSNEEVSVDFLKELSIYSAAVKKNEIEGISKAAQNKNFLIKDFAIFNKALLLAQSGKYTESKETLNLIPSTSSVSGLSKMLEHYLITK